MFGDAKLPSPGKMATLAGFQRRQTAGSWQVDATEWRLYGASLPRTGSLAQLLVLSDAKLPAFGRLALLGTAAVVVTAAFT